LLSIPEPILLAELGSNGRELPYSNDGYYDYHRAADITQLAAGLLGADTWIAWWD
jgi:hypothetical protein